MKKYSSRTTSLCVAFVYVAGCTAAALLLSYVYSFSSTIDFRACQLMICVAGEYLTTLLLFVGVHKDIRALVSTWLIYSTLMVSRTIWSGIDYLEDYQHMGDGSYYALHLIFIVSQLVCLSIVHGHYEQLGRKTQDTENLPPPYTFQEKPSAEEKCHS